MISIWRIDSAPCRTEVPTQSLPVSPPPITTTRFPVAQTGRAAHSRPITRFCPCRNSSAKMNSLRLAARDFQVARHRRADRQNDRVMAARQIVTGDVAPDFGVEFKADSGLQHELDAAVDDLLRKFEIRNPVAQESARSRVLLVDGHFVSRVIQRGGGGESGGDPRRSRPHGGPCATSGMSGFT